MRLLRGWVEPVSVCTLRHLLTSPFALDSQDTVAMPTEAHY